MASVSSQLSRIQSHLGHWPLDIDYLAYVNCRGKTHLDCEQG